MNFEVLHPAVDVETHNFPASVIGGCVPMKVVRPKETSGNIMALDQDVVVQRGGHRLLAKLAVITLG